MSTIPARPASGAPADRRVIHWLIVIVASTLATIPVWIPTFPPMTDLPQHASQIALLQLMSEPDFSGNQAFYINWFTPYLVGYLLVHFIAQAVGVLAACKLVVAVALAALPISTALLIAGNGGDSRWALLAIPAMYGFSFQWGFLNYLVATPLGIVFLWLTLRVSTSRRRWDLVALGVGINVLFFAHAMVCAFFGALAGLILLRTSTSPRTAFLRLGSLATVLPMALLWGLRTTANPLAQRPVFWDWNWFATADYYYWTFGQQGHGWGRLSGLLPRLVGGPPGALATLVGLSLFFLPLAAGATFTRNRTHWIPFSVCAFVLFLAPSTLFGTDFTFQRFTVFLLPFYLSTLRLPKRREWPRWTWGLAVSLSGVWITVTSFAAARYQQEATGFVDLLSRMEPRQRTLSFIYERDSPGMIAPPFLHFPAWYGALKGGIVDPNIAGTHVQLVLYRPGTIPAAHLWQFEWFPQVFEWSHFKGEQYRYFVVRSSVDRSREIFQKATCAVNLVHQSGRWWLYERSESCGPA